VLYHRCAELFPFLRARIESRGGQVRWICLGLETNVLEDSSWEFPLPGEDLETMLQAVASFRPTRILLNQRLVSRQMELLMHAAGGVSPAVSGIEPEADMRYVHEVDGWAGLDGSQDADELPLLLDSVEPNHDCEAGNALAFSLRPPVLVLGGPSCYYVAPLSRNACFDDVDLSRTSHHSGCTFCYMPERHLRYPYVTPPFELAIRQIRAARRTRPARRQADVFIVNGAAAFFQLRNLFETLLRDGDPPTRLTFRCRIDEFLRKEKDIEDLLPRLQSAGHSLGLLSMGLENFSPVENARFNKGISPAQIEKALELSLKWRTSYPGTFLQEAVGAHSHITFTPWTTLADLKTNLDFVLRCKPEFAIRSFLNSRAFLFPGLPLALLAEKDGLIAQSFQDPAFEHVERGCVTTPGHHEIPWHFLHGEVRSVYSVMVRLWENAALFDDPLYRTVRRASVRIGGSRESMFRFALMMVEAASSMVDQELECRPENVLAAALARAEAAGILLPASIESGPGDGEVEPAQPGPMDLLANRLLGDLAETLRLIHLHKPDLLRGYAPRTPVILEAPSGADKDWGSIGITLEKGTERMVLVFFDGSVRRSLASFGPFGVAHAPDTPLDSPERQAVAIQLLKAFARFAKAPIRMDDS
jgi:hypothetical protein